MCFYFVDWYLKVFLRPKIRYELKHGDMLTLADVRCQYLIGPLAEEVSCEQIPVHSNF